MISADYGFREVSFLASTNTIFILYYIQCSRVDRRISTDNWRTGFLLVVEMGATASVHSLPNKSAHTLLMRTKDLTRNEILTS